MKVKLNVLLLILPVMAMFALPSYGSEEAKKTYKLTKSGKEGGYSYVDLGLSVRWATYNVEATKPTEYGDHFAWGETSPKETYSWETYKWLSGRNLTKYSTEETFGIVDNKMWLEPEDDAAAVNWKGKWRMPTSSELRELIDGCDWECTKDMNGSGIPGWIGVSKKNGKVIFLPAAGYSLDDDRGIEGSCGGYWSSSLRSGHSRSACCLTFESFSIYHDGIFRGYGFSVRAVCPSGE